MGNVMHQSQNALELFFSFFFLKLECLRTQLTVRTKLPWLRTRLKQTRSTYGAISFNGLASWIKQQAQFSVMLGAQISLPLISDHKHNWTPVMPVCHLLYCHWKKRWQIITKQDHVMVQPNTETTLIQIVQRLHATNKIVTIMHI